MTLHELPIPLHSQDSHGRPRPRKLPSGKDPDVAIIKPRIKDVQEIIELINEFAAANLMLHRGPQYVYENIRDYIIAVDRNVTVRVEGGEPLYQIVACASLHVLWNDIAEIRSLAVHQDYQQRGYGRQIVEYLFEEARELEVHRLYTFTLSEPFFAGLGFRKIDRGDLPPKVWSECSRCPKYFRCDEVGMVLDL